MSATKNGSGISARKEDHIDVVLRDDVGFGRLTTGFEGIRFEHCALPELNLPDIDLSTSLFGKSVAAPFLISSMTGGPARAGLINTHLAEAAEELGIALGVGSQRVALEEDAAGGLSTDLRRRAPSIPLFGNLGAAQIVGEKGISRARRAVEMIEGDGLFIHLNPLQEAVQSGGDVDWRGVLAAIEGLVKAGLRLIVKEVGFGLSAPVVRQLAEAGVTNFDVAGAGGTNWARVEGARGTGTEARLAETFTEWGIPTARCVVAARAAIPDGTIIASGGIKTGLDAAKAIRLGADIVGQAAATLAPATEGTQQVVEHFAEMIDGLRISCFATGTPHLDALRRAPLQSAAYATQE